MLINRHVEVSKIERLSLSKFRMSWGSIALTIAAVVAAAWMNQPTETARTGPIDSSVTVSKSPLAASAVGAQTHGDVMLKPFTPSIQESVPPANKPINAVIQEGFQSTNYRQYVHQVLVKPSPTGIRISLEMISTCGLLGHPSFAPESLRFKLPADLQAEMARRKGACSQSTGPDLQQIRALVAAEARSFSSADVLLVYRSLKGSRDELSTFDRLGDVAGIANWGFSAESENLSLFAGSEQLLKIHSDGAASAAWQAAVCERFTCDDFNARIVRCRDDASCQMSLQDILKESAGVDDATWQQLLAAARRRLDALLPR